MHGETEKHSQTTRSFVNFCSCYNIGSCCFLQSFANRRVVSLGLPLLFPFESFASGVSVQAAARSSPARSEGLQVPALPDSRAVSSLAGDVRVHKLS
eukprot:1342084-Amphidinium_carterae.1